MRQALAVVLSLLVLATWVQTQDVWRDLGNILVKTIKFEDGTTMTTGPEAANRDANKILGEDVDSTGQAAADAAGSTLGLFRNPTTDNWEVEEALPVSLADPSSSYSAEDSVVTQDQLYKGGMIRAMTIAISDETTDLTTGTAKVTFRMPYAATLVGIRASVNTAPVGSTIIVDVNEGGTSVMTTNKLSIDASELTSTTAATAPGITDSDLADDAEMTVDIDQKGSSTAGKGLKICLYLRIASLPY